MHDLSESIVHEIVVSLSTANAESGKVPHRVFLRKGCRTVRWSFRALGCTTSDDGQFMDSRKDS